MTSKQQPRPHLRPNPGFTTGYNLDLDLFNTPKFSSQQFDYSSQSPLFSVGDISISTYPKNEDLEKLMAKSAVSKVGKGTQTVTDTSVRKSFEILFVKNSKEESDDSDDDDDEDSSERAVLSPEFQSFLEEKLDIISQHLRHATKIKLIPYKVVLYSEGCHFDGHIDSNHVENMIMTLSVQIATSEYSKGGNLVISGSEDSETPMAPITPPNAMRLNLFYSDVKHHVTTVETGYRLSLVCDVVQTRDPNPDVEILQDDSTKFLAFCEEAKKRGATSIGISASHIYMGNSLSIDDLKGQDRIMAILFSQIGTAYLAQMSNMDGTTVRKEVVEICKMTDSFSTLYNNEEDSTDYDEDTGEYVSKSLFKGKFVTDKSLYRTKDITKFEPSLDTENIYKVISSEYLLGSTAFIVSKEGKFRLTYSGRDDIYLGNEGFEGQIFSTVAIMVNF